MDPVIRSSTSASADGRRVDHPNSKPSGQVRVLFDQNLPQQTSEPIPTLVKSLDQGRISDVYQLCFGRQRAVSISDCSPTPA